MYTRFQCPTPTCNYNYQSIDLHHTDINSKQTDDSHTHSLQKHSVSNHNMRINDNTIATLQHIDGQIQVGMTNDLTILMIDHIEL